ncbi:hypothetical protein [Kineococcus rhizosphaerae]|uniref:hypothetical protein n=1 Tax=Kineococcus rhizosphaerae TaxID=559628 RepID=UPI001FE8CF0C|nr:hypothetical protein [Kineococcus rhizosphaerae]
MDPVDLDEGGLVAAGSRRRGSGAGGVVGAGGDLQLAADRLDPELVLVLVDEVDDLGDLIWCQRMGRSSSAAKKADARRRIGGLKESAQHP